MFKRGHEMQKFTLSVLSTVRNRMYSTSWAILPISRNGMQILSQESGHPAASPASVQRNDWSKSAPGDPTQRDYQLELRPFCARSGWFTILQGHAPQGRHSDPLAERWISDWNGKACPDIGSHDGTSSRRRMRLCWWRVILTTVSPNHYSELKPHLFWGLIQSILFWISLP